MLGPRGGPFRVLAMVVLACVAASLMAQTGDSLRLPTPGPVINEIMYHAPEDRDDLQFIELHNPTANKVDLSGWSLTGECEFRFPWSATLPPGSFMVVCSDIAVFRGQFGRDVPIAGSFMGRLNHTTGAINLVDPQGCVVERVDYSDRSPWPMGADGYGGSLERICPTARADDPMNWAACSGPGALAGTPGMSNKCFSAGPLPRIDNVQCKKVAPDQPIEVSARVVSNDGIESVRLKWCAWWDQGNTTWSDLVMRARSGPDEQDVYGAVIPPQPAGRLVRFTVCARDKSGAERLCPAPTEPRPTFSCGTFINTNTARISFMKVLTMGSVKRLVGSRRQRAVMQIGGASQSGIEPAWGCAITYMPPNSRETWLFDHVQVRPRRGGLKAHFHKDQPLFGMTGINVLFESSPRRVLSEYLAYELYQRAGVLTPASEHVRLWVDDRLAGYHLLVEQPNQQFLRRSGRNANGNLYKLIWYERGLVGQHEKKTHAHTGHQDLIDLAQSLDRASGTAQWDVIQQQFDVDAMINYYAVNMCIQNWDGFFNNYFAYHDPRQGGKWEMIPWDEDKTWGDHDGASRMFDWYDMPLTMGMNGDRPPGGSIFGRWFWRNQSWWRPPGHFSGPLLANAEFRRRFLLRLENLCDTLFTPDVMGPIISAMEERLEPDIELRAELFRTDPALARREFKNHIRSFHAQVAGRRQFILGELGRKPQETAWSPPGVYRWRF